MCVCESDLVCVSVNVTLLEQVWVCLPYDKGASSVTTRFKFLKEVCNTDIL